MTEQSSRAGFQNGRAENEKTIEEIDEHLATLDQEQREEGERVERMYLTPKLTAVDDGEAVNVKSEDVSRGQDASGRMESASDANVPQAAGYTHQAIKKPLPLSDLGNAERAYDLYGSRLRYTTDSRKWHFFDVNKGIWNSNGEARVHKWMRQTILLIPNEVSLTENEGERKQIKAHGHASQAEPRIEAAIRLLRFLWDVPVTESAFDRSGHLLSFLDGTYDARNNEFRDHNREDMITRRCSTKYDPTVTSCIWENFVDQITLGDKEYAAFLQRCVGYSIFGNNSERIVFFVHGEGATGKSTFLSAIRALLGRYAATVDPVTFMSTKTPRTGPRSDLVRLANTRLIVTDECEADSSLAVGLLKRWCGNDTLVARGMYRKEEVEFDARGTLWINSNHCPKVDEKDQAAWDRIIRLPFENRIPKSRQNPDLKQILSDQNGCCITGIATWAIRGWQMFQEAGLAVPDIAKKSTEEYRAEQNPLHDFLAERLRIGIDHPYETVGDVFADYERWCEDIEVDWQDRLTKHAFGAALKARGVDQARVRLPDGKVGRVWLRVQLVADEESEPSGLPVAGEVPLLASKPVDELRHNFVNDETTSEDNDLPF